MTSLNASPPRDQTVTGARLTYRPEIDGLRAIAVLSVLLFHSHVPGFSGGYVGVDVFFVISGYIITCIVCREREAGQFSVAAFYERRIRRIAPALFVMSFGVLVLGAVLLPATHLKTLFGDVAAVSLLVSNLWQESQVSYFGALAKDRALIHTWSLSLEEQFYLVYPVAFLVLWRTGGDRLFRIVLAVACLSFVLYVGLQLAARHSFAFYATPTRAWQLLAGCALALWQQQRSGWSDVYALLGLASILFSVTGLTALTSSTAVASCVATAGAVAILGSRFDLGPARWILGARPLVAIGLISYSLYLWHQPLLALLHVKTVGHPSPTAYALTIFAVFVVSIASWFLVEQPCRKHRFAGRATVYLTFLFCTGLLAGVGVLGYTSQGLPGRFASDHLLTAIETSPIRSECRAATPCRIGSGVADWAVLGDSHMIELAWALGAHQQRHGKSVVQYTRPGCPPALAFRPNRRGCEAWYRNALQALVDDPEVSRVLVGWRYTAFLFGDHLDVYPGVRSQSVSANFHPDERSISDEDAIDAYWRGVVETVSQLQAAGKTVHIVWPIPELPAHVSELLTPFSVLSRAEPLQAPHGTTWDYYRKRNAVALEKLGRLGYSAQLVAVKPSESVCDASHCFAARDGHVLYFDEDHLSVAGAERVLTSAGVVPEQ